MKCQAPLQQQYLEQGFAHTATSLMFYTLTRQHTLCLQLVGQVAKSKGYTLVVGLASVLISEIPRAMPLVYHKRCQMNWARQSNCCSILLNTTQQAASLASDPCSTVPALTARWSLTHRHITHLLRLEQPQMMKSVRLSYTAVVVLKLNVAIQYLVTQHTSHSSQYTTEILAYVGYVQQQK